MSILREIKIFLFLFFFLTLSMHFSAWVSHPVEHLKALASSPLGIYHPLYITLAIYLIVGILRVFIKGVKRVGKKR